MITVAWWPFDSYWLSDDFLVVHYASDFGRALSDFAGCQVGLEGPVFFYRPLITLSFAVEIFFTGVDPLLSHVDNALAHSVNSVLVAVLAVRFVPRSTAVLTGLAWGLAPHHSSAVSWAVGRVDVFATFWCLCSVFWCVRVCEARTQRLAPGLVAFGLALCCKESAAILPAWIGMIVFLVGRGSRTDRTRAAARMSVRFALVLAVYVVVRRYAIGRWIGGYGWDVPSVAPSPNGLLVWTWRWLAPLDRAWVEDPVGILVLAGLPIVSCCLLVIRRHRLAWVSIGLLLFVIAFAPTYLFWERIENPKNLRYMYLASTALTLLLAAGGNVPLLLFLCSSVLPLIEVRSEFLTRYERNRQTHAAVLASARDLRIDDAPLFVSGLAIQNKPGTAIAFHRGTDRIARPPFLVPGRRLFALRPWSPSPRAHPLPHGKSYGLPFGHTVRVEEAGARGPTVHPVPAPDLLPLPVVVEGESTFDATTLLALYRRESFSRIVSPIHADAYRLTVFTADGYFVTHVAPDRTTDDRDTIDVFTWLKDSRYTDAPYDFLALGLKVPIALDLDPNLPLLVEAGSLEDGRFVATHAARDPVWLRFDRSFNDVRR